MKPQQLISAGFAITAFVAASIPALGFTLLGEVAEPPTVSAQTSWDPPAQPVAVALRFPDPAE
jgi:hypothetical protein